MDYHEHANIFPLMDGESFMELIEDIRLNGLLEPITIYDGKILDGRNRYRACIEAGIKPKFEQVNGKIRINNKPATEELLIKLLQFEWIKRS